MVSTGCASAGTRYRSVRGHFSRVLRLTGAKWEDAQQLCRKTGSGIRSGWSDVKMSRGLVRPGRGLSFAAAAADMRPRLWQRLGKTWLAPGRGKAQQPRTAWHRLFLH